MSALSCDCDYEAEPGVFCWYYPGDFELMPTLSRRKRCVSCKILIAPNSEVLCFKRDKVPATEVECKIYGENGEIPLAPWYLCEKCGEVFLTLYEIGYKCIDPRKTLQAQKEYWDMTGFNPEKYQEKSV